MKFGTSFFTSANGVRSQMSIHKPIYRVERWYVLQNLLITIIQDDCIESIWIDIWLGVMYPVLFV